MEFVPGPAVHRVLCADCGKLFRCCNICFTDLHDQEPRLSPILLIYALHVSGIRECLQVIQEQDLSVFHF